MKKLFTAFLLVCIGSQINAQITTIETMDSLPNTGSSYTDGSFTGVNGIQWDFVKSKTDNGYQIDGQSLILRKSSENSAISSTGIPGGISSFSVDLKKAYTGGGNRQVEVFINGSSIGQSIAFDDTLVHNFSVTGLTTTGNIDIEIKNITSKQVLVDNITWTTYSSTSTTPEISFNNTADTVTMEVFASALPVNYDFNYTFSNFTPGVDGLVKYAYVDASSNLSFDTTSTGTFSLDLTEFGTHSVAIGFTDLAGTPNLTIPQDTFVVVLNETVITDVATIADLRTQTEGEYYRLTGEAVISYQQNFRNQKYIQDATAGILIDDNDDVITGTFNVYDGLTNITGILTSYNGMKQFKPTVDVTTASSTGNTITPVVITTSELNANMDDYESEVVQIQNATVTADTNIFLNGKNLTITDAAGTAVFRTQFYNVDYIGTEIPGEAHYTGVAIRYNSTAQLVSRNLADICLVDFMVSDFTYTLTVTEPTTVGEPFTVEAAFQGATGFESYSWDFGDGSATSADINPVHTFTSNGTYTVELTVTNHCGIEKTISATVVVEGVGLEENGAFTMFPVPAKDVLNVNFANNTEKVVAVYNALGIKIAEQLATSNAKINTTKYSSGIYMMVVTEGGKSTVKRFVVE